MEPVSPWTTTSMETPSHTMPVMAASRKIIHIGMPSNRSTTAPIAMIVSILPLGSFGLPCCFVDPALPPSAEDGNEVAEECHCHQAKAQGNRQGLRPGENVAAGQQQAVRNLPPHAVEPDHGGKQAQADA